MDLPVVKLEDKKLLAELVGKSKYKGFYGVYMFIHKQTGKKYVGSSNLLRRRMDYYFKGDFPLQPLADPAGTAGAKEGGKFLTLLKRRRIKRF